jgi:hypothetical protein
LRLAPQKVPYFSVHWLANANEDALTAVIFTECIFGFAGDVVAINGLFCVME